MKAGTEPRRGDRWLHYDAKGKRHEAICIDISDYAIYIRHKTGRTGAWENDIWEKVPEGWEPIPKKSSDST